MMLGRKMVSDPKPITRAPRLYTTAILLPFLLREKEIPVHLLTRKVRGI
jgi:hypothetical protein